MKNKVVCFNRTNQKGVWVIVDVVISSFLLSGHRSTSITLHGVWSLMMWLQLQMKRCRKEKGVRLGWWSSGKRWFVIWKLWEADTWTRLERSEWKREMRMNGELRKAVYRRESSIRFFFKMPTCCYRCRWKRWPRKYGLINESMSCEGLLDSKKQCSTRPDF